MYATTGVRATDGRDRMLLVSERKCEGKRILITEC